MIADHSNTDHTDDGKVWTGRMPTLQDVYRARKTIRQYLPVTPLIPVESLSQRLGFELSIKAESLNPTGAFKIRGGLNWMSNLPEDQRSRGVVAASTGNHGQSIAYAGRAFGVDAYIFVPEVANELKMASMRQLGATIIQQGADFDACCAAAMEFAREHDKRFIHSSDEPDLIAGVATYTLEILEEQPGTDVMFVPIGGGSGCCGAVLAGKGINPSLEVIGVQAAGAPVVFESWRARSLKVFDQVETFAEGLATRTAFKLPARMLWDRVDEIMLVSDREMKQAILTLLESTRLLAEGAGAAALAAAYQRRESLQGKRVVVVVSGGNLTRETLEQVLSEERAW